ncbi:MAG: hypothetical protein IJI84_01755 [Clostridia bacterium]|nr:hypothetical protein [Clostridia bacterium]
MKKILKILSFAIYFGVLSFNLTSVFAGNGHSKPKKPDENSDSSGFTQSQLAVLNNPIYFPIYSNDGGIAYFSAWNGINGGKDFEMFLKRYEGIIENEKSANELLDSEKNENWSTSYAREIYSDLESFENEKDLKSGKCFLRVNESHKIIYTVRKSGSTYLFTYYLTVIQYGRAMVSPSCYVISSDMRNTRETLRPTDKMLINIFTKL